MKERDYVAPSMEVVVFEPEKGFATSPDMPISPWDQDTF